MSLRLFTLIVQLGRVGDDEEIVNDFTVIIQYRSSVAFDIPAICIVGVVVRLMEWPVDEIFPNRFLAEKRVFEFFRKPGVGQ